MPYFGTVIAPTSYMIDINKALLNPASVFNSPEEIFNAHGIPTNQKIEILRRWKWDLLQQVAEEENMVGLQLNLLGRVRKALRQLDEEINLE